MLLEGRATGRASLFSRPFFASPVVEADHPTAVRLMNRHVSVNRCQQRDVRISNSFVRGVVLNWLD